MRLRLRHMGSASFALVLACGAVAPALAAEEPTSAEVFDDTTVHEIRLAMHSGDWGALQEHYLQNTFYPADVTVDGYTVRNAGVRSRGTGSRDARKPGLRVTFDEYVSDQTFAGLKGLVLDNFRQDPAMMKESLSMALFARMGLAAPRVSHARVYVNDDYLGLFAIIEPIDKRFLRRALGEDSGYLYEFEWAGAYRFEWLGDDPMRYAEMFESETRESEPAAQRFSTLVQMITATTRESTSAWQRTMGRYFDFDTLFAYVAVESFLADHDGLGGDWGINNFYLYRFAGSDRFQFLPWDKDVTFREVDRDVYESLAGHHLFATALQFGALRDAYERALRRCAAIAAEVDGSGRGWLEREVGRHAAQIRAAALDDQNKAWSNERFEQEVAWMSSFARQRSGQIARQVGR
jgi:spore coat protein CotH